MSWAWVDAHTPSLETGTVSQLPVLTSWLLDYTSSISEPILKGPPTVIKEKKNQDLFGIAPDQKR